MSRSKLPFSFVKIISLVEGRSVCWFLHQSLTLAPNQPREPPPQARPRHYKPSPCSCHRHKSTQLYKFTSLGRYYFGWTQHIERNKHHYWGYLKTYHRPPLRWMFNPRQSRMSTWMNDWLWATNLSWAGLQYASRERGSSAISQNYPPLGNSSLFEEKTSAKGWVLNIGRALFSMWTSGGYTRWPENIQRAIKYPEIGRSRYPRLRNGEMLQQQGAFCIVTNGLADGLNRGKRMKGGEEEGNDYPSLISKGP